MPHQRRCLVALLILLSLQVSVATAAAQVNARFTVLLPESFEPDNDQYATELIVDGMPVTVAGSTHEFEAPPGLEAGWRRQSTFTARFHPNNYTVITRTRTVSFGAGETVTVDLREQHPNDRARVRFVPTPAHVIDEMMVLANVKEEDVVYEPGCGDARMTIAAVRAGARRGLCIDIDPERVAEARAAVKTAGLEDRIEIRLGDALEVEDLSETTLVLLYMGDEFDMLIRPILWRRLRTGARVVSHRFGMGDWEPDESREATEWDPGVRVHLWNITEEVKRRVEQESPQTVGQP
jgi:uncharacterized protein (TIGR03000 family)